jgi:hypothetical protein
MAREELVSTAVDLVEAIQNFDAAKLVQSERLGATNFQGAVEPASKIINIFKEIDITKISDLPDSQIKIITEHGEATAATFSEILNFDVEAGNISARIQDLNEQLRVNFDERFRKLTPISSYLLLRTLDLESLKRNHANTLTEMSRTIDTTVREMETAKTRVDEILDNIRETAGKAGASKEAHHFEQAANNHKADANYWRLRTIWCSAAVGCFGVLMLFLHRAPWFKPNDIPDAIQLLSGKLIIFFILVYLTTLCAKNFLSNRHNEIVNRHRQNALLTYKTLADGASSAEVRDVILNHAASSIYSLHDTGYTRAPEVSAPSASSLINLIPKAQINSS